MKRCEKGAPIRLDATTYRQLHRRILERDGWGCQVCGTLRNLQVHHIKFRSRGGSDLEENLITLCVECHAKIHRGRGTCGLVG
jgi:5-methylcytosine-specific restriction endonuclease McrA